MDRNGCHTHLMLLNFLPNSLQGSLTWTIRQEFRNQEVDFWCKMLWSKSLLTTVAGIHLLTTVAGIHLLTTNHLDWRNLGWRNLGWRNLGWRNLDWKILVGKSGLEKSWLEMQLWPSSLVWTTDVGGDGRSVVESDFVLNQTKMAHSFNGQRRCIVNWGLQEAPFGIRKPMNRKFPT